MTSDPQEPITIAFLGYAGQAMAALAVAYEDEVLPLLKDHGARVLYRGRRSQDQDECLPLEVHLLWFPHRQAFESYLADDRRRQLLEQHGDVFTRKETIEMVTIEAIAT